MIEICKCHRWRREVEMKEKRSDIFALKILCTIQNIRDLISKNIVQEPSKTTVTGKILNTLASLLELCAFCDSF